MTMRKGGEQWWREARGGGGGDDGGGGGPLGGRQALAGEGHRRGEGPGFPLGK